MKSGRHFSVTRAPFWLMISAFSMLWSPVALCSQAQVEPDTPAQAHEKLLAGQPVLLPASGPEAQRTIEADWIQEAVSKSQPVNIHYAIIHGKLSLKGPVKEFGLQWCKVENQADFSQTTFKGSLDLSWTEFHGGANFEGATFEHETSLVSAQFWGGVTFANAHTNGKFIAKDVKFWRSGIYDSGSISFDHATFDKQTSFLNAQFELEADFDNAQLAESNFRGTTFRSGARFAGAAFADAAAFSAYTLETRRGPQNHPVTFWENADFTKTRFGGSTEFKGAEFKRGAIFAGAHFDSVTDTASFDGTRFQGVDFTGARIAGNIEFMNAVFGADASFAASQWGRWTSFQAAEFKGNTSFTDAHFAGSAYFGSADPRHLTTFVSVDFINAQFDSLAEFYNVVFSKYAGFNRAHFLGAVVFKVAAFKVAADFSDTEVGREALFQQAVFRDSSFDRAKLSGGAFFSAARFTGKASFLESQISRQADFQDVHFGGDCVFSQVVVAGYASFRSASFAGEAEFSKTQVAADADFRGAIFEKAADFEHAHIGGDGLFGGGPRNKPAAFHGKANLSSTEFGGDADFGGVHFEKEAIFSAAHIAGKAIFGASGNVPAPEFNGAIDFSAARFGGDAGFAGTNFKGKATFGYADIAGHGRFSQTTFSREFPATFNGVHFHEEASFDQAVFGSRADFRNAQFELGAFFRGARFGNRVDFSEAHFIGPVDFGGKGQGGADQRAGATFSAKVLFEHAQFDTDAEFYNAVFDGKDTPENKDTSAQTATIDFRGATIKSIFFKGRGANDDGGVTQFRDATVDLRGCIYQRMEGDWRALFRRGGDTRISPYDRQPYVLLEEVFRKMGNDEEADAVYLERREVERKQERSHRHFLSWLADSLYGLFAKYGVDSSRLSLVALFCVLGGTFVFSRPGAVSARRKEAETVGSQTSLTVWEALKVSIHYFTPVDIPMGSEWVPSERVIDLRFRVGKRFVGIKLNPSTYAAVFLTLAGWILVPLGIAALTGLLRRSGP